jgi:hypothetical protein
MTIEIRDPSLEARIRKQIQTTGSSSVEEVLLRLLEATLGSVILSEATASRMRSSRAVEGSLTRVQCADPAGSFRQRSRLLREHSPRRHRSSTLQGVLRPRCRSLRDRQLRSG